MHPHKSEASESSRSKMRAITGRGGGGTGFVGGSPFKRAGADGEQKSYLGHEKVFASPKAAGGKVKGRADKFRRGGKVRKAGGGPTGTGPAHPDRGDRYSPAKRFEDENPALISRAQLGPMGTQKDATTPEEMDLYQSVAPGYERDYGHVDPSGAPVGPSPPASTPDEDVPQSRRGGRIKRARGGKVNRANGGDVSSEYGNEPAVGEASSGQGQGSWPSGRRPYGGAGESEPPAGRLKRADGGRTMMPYGNERRSGSRSKTAKKGGNVNIAINMPPHIPHPGGGLPPVPPGGPAGGAGGPPGMPPGGGAPPPAIPPALMGGAGGAPGGPPGAGGAPGGMNPAAMQALAGIAGGAGGPMGAGAPGRGPFAKGGAVKSTGLTSNMKHWQDYSTRNVKGNSAQNRGATGESAELPLRMPDDVKGARDAEVAKKRGGRGEGGKYARGGRAAGGKIPVNVKGGSETGVGRKRQADLQASWRRG